MDNKRPFLDFKAIKARVSIADVLGHYGVTLTCVNRTSLKGNCPLPTHSSKSKGTFFVNDAKAVWYCHSGSCKKNGDRAGGNIIDFVAQMESLSVYDAAGRLDELFPATGGDLPQVRYAGDADQSRSSSSESVAGANKPLTFTLKDVNPQHAKIQERGISVETAALFGIGYFPGKGSMSGRIVFPLHEDGHLVGYAGRTMEPITDENPKWRVGKGLRKTFLYNLERCDPVKPLVLVESCWAPPFFHERGVQSASLMGTEMTEEQERRLIPFRTIVVAFDNDAAGEERAVVIRERLKARHTVLRARLVE